MDRPWIEAGLKYARITKPDLPSLLVQRVARLRVKQSVDQRFLFYLIGSKDFTNHVLAVQIGTSVPHISGGQIKEYEFSLPSLPEQQAIARILGTLDDKIELNRRMNQTLEGLARALFRSWFVDFDPVVAKAAGRRPLGMNAATAKLFPDSFADSLLGPIPMGGRLERLAHSSSNIVAASPPVNTRSEYLNITVSPHSTMGGVLSAT
jgi:type I restriction enzyme S subunit